MVNFAKILKDKRAEKMLTLKEVSDSLNIDVALVSKIERGDRRATKKQAIAFINFYILNKKEILILWLSEKIVSDLQHEEYALDSLYVAEKSLKSLVIKKDEPVIDAQIKALLKEIEKLKNKWKKLKIEKATELEKVEEHFILSNIYESNRISGNTLTVEETNLVINEGLTIEGKSMTEHLEAINHLDALEFINELVSVEAVSEENLKELHYLLLKGIQRKNAGKYRTKSIKLKESKHIPPQVNLLEKKMKDIFTFYKNSKDKIHPVILSAEIHEKIAFLHPFKEGNGKAIRLMMNLILKLNEYPVINVSKNYKTKIAYFKALEKAHVSKDNKDFKVLICKQVLDSLQKHIDMINLK